MALLYVDSFESGTNPGVYSWIAYSLNYARSGSRSATSFVYPTTGPMFVVGIANMWPGEPFAKVRFYGTGTSTYGTGTDDKVLMAHRLSADIMADGRFAISCSRNTEVYTDYIDLTGGYHLTKRHWYYIEFQGVNAGVSTNYALHCNGAVLGTGVFTFTNTTLVGGLDWSEISCPGQGGGATTYRDDFYLSDGVFYGDIAVKNVSVDGAGALAEWTPTPGTLANYQCVDDTTPNNDTDYVGADEGTVLTDLYSVGEVSTFTGGNVYPQFELVVAYPTTTNTGDLLVCHVLYDGTSTATYTNTASSVWASYVPKTVIVETNPFTSAPWTIEEIEALQYGPQQVN